MYEYVYLNTMYDLVFVVYICFYIILFATVFKETELCTIIIHIDFYCKNVVIVCLFLSLYKCIILKKNTKNLHKNLVEISVFF